MSKKNNRTKNRRQNFHKNTLENIKQKNEALLKSIDIETQQGQIMLNLDDDPTLNPEIEKSLFSSYYILEKSESENSESEDSSRTSSTFLQKIWHLFF